MVKPLYAYTEEIDDIDAAVSTILEQLDVDGNLLSNTCGILTFYSEFVDTGVITALCERLPFPVVGTTTMGTAVPGVNGSLLLGLMVLTSDDVTFSAVMTESLTGDLREPIEAAYAEGVAALGEAPKLIMPFAPLIFHHAGDDYVDILNELSGGAPCFGTLTVDLTADYRECGVLHNGRFAKDRMALLFLGGAVAPDFIVVSIAEEKVWQRSAVITASKGNVLREVNNQPLARYLEGIGLAKEGVIASSVNTFPFVLDYNDGTRPVVRALLQVTPDNCGACGGRMPVGASLSVATFNRTDVLATTTDALTQVMAKQNRSALIMLSCAGRSMALGADTTAEMALLDECLGSSLPYLFAYSGGEICPVDGGNGTQINRFHNDTLVACLL